MRKRMMVLGVLVLAAVVASPAMACDGTAAKQAKNDGSSCATGSAKAAYAKTLEETGCEKTAKAAYNNTLAEGVYAKSYAETSCSKTATKAAHAAVLAETDCSKTADAAATHAVARASYDETLAKTSCEKSAQAAYEKVAKNVGTSCAVGSESAKNSDCCDKKGAAAAQAKAGCNRSNEGTAEQPAQTGTTIKVASNENSSSN